MKVIGLTGGIASGKTLVARMLRDLGAHVIDADALAREVVAPGAPAYREVVAAFGPAVVRPDGTLDRAALAARVFGDPQARATLNRIVHPHVRQRMAEALAAAAAAHPDGVIVLVIPLLLDTAPADLYPFDGIVVVWLDEAAQEARLMARDGLTREEARARIAAQRPLREKLAEATWVIDNSGTPEETRRQVEALWRRWQGEAGQQGRRDARGNPPAP
ncbi:MAG: dephospho-CoA kinase [Armatimonadota bacterium]|nr:dephospho-CoA kinase [Armatimonadota bacterium]